MKQIRIFLASSNDMMKYRKLAESVIDEFNDSVGDVLDISAWLFRWEKKFIPEMGRPQDIIFEQSDFDNIDIFIGLIGARFGTPTGGKNSKNQEYESGTEEEYDRAYNNYLHGKKKPHIMIFHDNSPLDQTRVDLEQLGKVRAFLQQFEANRDNPGLYRDFKNAKDFQNSFRIAITKCLLRIARANAKPDAAQGETAADSHDADLSPRYQQIGFQKLFVTETNHLRSDVKRAAIKGSSIVYLLGKTGNSFLGGIGNRYLDLLIHNVRHGAKVRILLLNPWTMDAAETAFAESGNTEMLEQIFRHDIASQEVIEAYRGTRWFRGKLMDVINEYESIRKEHPEIELRFIDADVSAAVLITDSTLFFEPYYNYCHSSRLKKITSTFEAAVQNTNPLYQDSLKMFDLLWSNSISYDDLIQAQPLHIIRLSNFIDALSVHNTMYYVGVHAMIRKGGRFLVLHRTKTKTYMADKWDIPGGSMEKGETVEETLLREIREETGLSVKIGKVLYVYSNFAELPNRQTLQVIVEASQPEGSICLKPSEHSAYRWVTAQEAARLPLINFLESYLKSIGEI